jgi:hypothetical protein
MTPRQPDTSRQDGRAGRVAVDGWLLLASLCFLAGTVTLIVTWYKISGLALVAEKLPYFASGGLGGLALVIAGAGCLSAGRSARIEARLVDLLSIATEPVGAVGATAEPLPAGPDTAADTTADTASGTAADSAAGTAVLTGTGGTTYHRPGRRLVQGKETGTQQLGQAIANGLGPCPVCH